MSNSKSKRILGCACSFVFQKLCDCRGLMLILII